MELQTETLVNSAEQERRQRAEDTFWQTAGTLYSRRKFIVGMTTLVAIAAIIIALILPKWYQATARVMMPAPSSGGGLTTMLGDLGPAAMALFRGGSGNYIRYLAILNSRTLREKMVNEFDLINAYEIEESDRAREDALELLSANTEIEVDMEFDWLAIHVLDKDPKRAADMANFYVMQLNERNAQLQSENARTYRKFVERRYSETEAMLDSTRAQMQQFQEKYGVIELTTQGEAFMGLVAQYRAEMLRGEIQAEGLRRDYGSDNSIVQSANQRVIAAQQKMDELLAGKDALMPIPFKQIPEVGRHYAEVLQELIIQAKIIEFTRPLLEQAIFEEQREAPAVQVLDLAHPPVLKAKPKRTILVIAATFSGFLLIVIFVLIHAWLRRNHVYIANRLTHTTNHQP